MCPSTFLNNGHPGQLINFHFQLIDWFIYEFSLKSIYQQTLVVALHKNEKPHTHSSVYISPQIICFCFTQLTNLSGLELNTYSHNLIIFQQ